MTGDFDSVLSTLFDASKRRQAAHDALVEALKNALGALVTIDALVGQGEFDKPIEQARAALKLAGAE